MEGVKVILDVKYSYKTLEVEWKPIDEQDVEYTVECSTTAGDVNKPPEQPEMNVVNETSTIQTNMCSTKAGDVRKPPKDSLKRKTVNNERSTILTDLEEGTRYYIWVKAKSTRGESPWSDRMIGATCKLHFSMVK